MKELTIEQKAQRYDEAINAIKELKAKHPTVHVIKDWIKENFPELAESEDERIRKALIDGFTVMKESKNCGKTFSNHNIPVTDILAWLKKQGEKKPNSQMEKCINCQFVYTGYCDGTCILKNNEQKPADKVEPKFHEGDWIIYDINGEKGIDKIVEFDNDKVIFESGEWSYIYELNKDSKLWTIQDAKDGDVLCSEQIILLFKKFAYNNDWNHIIAYAGIDTTGKLQITDEQWVISSYVHPATKEQRDTLMKAMADAGYTFDFEKKELKNIEQKLAWSEEDERILKSIIINIENLQFSSDMREKYQHIPNTSRNYYQIMVDWLKSLKERYVWKPSDEQMDALHYVTNFDYGGHKATLVSLYEQLKKLKE